MAAKRKIPTAPRDAFCVRSWFERDRAHVAIWMAPWEVDDDGDIVIDDDCTAGEVVDEWWDDDVFGLIEDGFFKVRGPRSGIDADSVIDYAVSLGSIAVAD